jgi:hercynylcysteine S-oxide lyase
VAAEQEVLAEEPLTGSWPHAVRDRLLTGHGIVTTAEHPPRAPREMTGPLLRISPHVDCTDADLALLRAALAGLPGSG